MPQLVPSKDPNEVLDYTVDWTNRLDGDTISSSSAVLEEGDVTIDSQSFSGANQTVWLSGGTENVTSIVTLRVETAGGRTYDEAIKVKLKDKAS